MKHTYTIEVPSFLCRPDDQVGYDGMASLFQEAAWQHAERLGVDFTDGADTLYWVLHRLGIRFRRRPRWGETLTISTWPSRIVRLFAMREYVVHNQEGETLAEASSAWIILDGEKRRPVRPDTRLSREWALEEVPLQIPTGKLPEISNPQDHLVDAIWDRVRPSDTDRNDHVNNGRYAQWLSDWAPETVAPDGGGVFSFTAETRKGQEFSVISAGAEESIPVAEVWVRNRGAEISEAVCACRFVPFQGTPGEDVGNKT